MGSKMLWPLLISATLWSLMQYGHPPDFGSDKPQSRRVTCSFYI
jgi:hypothetical protein